MQSKLCIFIGYLDNCKSYRCLSKFGWIYTSGHVIFDELKYPYKVAFLTNSATSANASTTSLPSIPLVTPHAPHANVLSYACASIPIVHTTTNLWLLPTYMMSLPLVLSMKLLLMLLPHLHPLHLWVYNLHLETFKFLLLSQSLVCSQHLLPQNLKLQFMVCSTPWQQELKMGFLSQKSLWLKLNLPQLKRHCRILSGIRLCKRSMLHLLKTTLGHRFPSLKAKIL